MKISIIINYLILIVFLYKLQYLYYKCLNYLNNIYNLNITNYDVYISKSAEVIEKSYDVQLCQEKYSKEFQTKIQEYNQILETNCSIKIKLEKDAFYIYRYYVVTYVYKYKIQKINNLIQDYYNENYEEILNKTLTIIKDN
ncbi:hypothetical protein AB837_00622 [bacterium AB1]|nr:hypothetical protein AB837_00622 [bacterium AB1]